MVQAVAILDLSTAVFRGDSVTMKCGSGEIMGKWVLALIFPLALSANENANSSILGLEPFDAQVRPASKPPGLGPLKQPSPVPINSAVVRICFSLDPDIKQGCERGNQTLKNCGLRVIEIWDPTASEIRTKLKAAKLPANTNVVLSSHGVPFGGELILPTPPGVGEVVDKSKYKIRLPDGTPVQNFVRSGDILKAVTEALQGNSTEGAKPSVWVSTCHSGLCLSQELCVGASSQPDEFSYMDPDGVEYTEKHLTTLMCEPERFYQFDKNKNGALETEEMAASFCREFGPGLVKRKAFPKLVESRYKDSLDIPHYAIISEKNSIEHYEQRERAANPGMLVQSSKSVSVWGIEYENESGNRVIAKQPTNWGTKELTLKRYTAEAPTFADDCTKVVRTAAKKCKLIELAEVYVVDIRDPKRQACIYPNAMTGMTQHVDVGTYRLYPTKPKPKAPPSHLGSD